ncbi:MAG: SPOR domain-containing protein [Spirochaetaceae bacterium]|jgi:hypothetical protein|nr:SPOR domain-containing protein [Spirochaetaceae bacterium]
MGSIKKCFFSCIVFSLLLSPPVEVYLHGQSAFSGSVPAAAEIQALEQKLIDPGTPVVERREIMVRLAGLFRLLGDLEAAARIWTEAAGLRTAPDPAVPGDLDDRALLEGARCFAAIGELDKADAQVQRVLQTGKDAGILRTARYLGAQIKTFRSGDVSALAALADDGGYGEYQASLYYTQWKVSGDDRYKSRLLTEYPDSPEARILKDEGGAVSAAPFVWWFLFPGREAVTLSSPMVSGGSPAGANSLDQNPRPPEGKAAEAVLQAGLFSREENARALADRLRHAGFQADITRRTVKGVDYWAVNVPMGNDMGRTILLLKDSGFESFPVFP